jgi:hypothetical protein
MTPTCDAPLGVEALVSYWAGDLPEQAAALLEAHLFACAACADALREIAALGDGVATLARQGQVSGIISRAVMNCLARDGVRVRLYSIAPGQAVPCAVWPDDDVVVVALRADLVGVTSVSLSITGGDDRVIHHVDDGAVSPEDGELLYASPGGLIRQMPSVRVRFTLADNDSNGRVLGEYVLEHSASHQ